MIKDMIKCGILALNSGSSFKMGIYGLEKDLDLQKELLETTRTKLAAAEEKSASLRR